MLSNASITRELLFAYFEGQVPAWQKQLIEHWIKSPENEEFFYACLHAWELNNPYYQADVNQAIARFNQHISNRPDQVISPAVAGEILMKKQAGRTAVVTTRWTSWLVAASAVLLLGCSGWLLKDAVLYKTFQSGYGQVRTLVLADGSKVTLNANSRLLVPRFGFGKFSRQVALRGEASFRVVHTPDHKKFVVLTGNQLQVEVLGTAFNVFARSRATKIGLYQGKVKVRCQQGADQAKSFLMVPGDLLTRDHARQTVSIKKVQHPENFVAWQQGRFIFDRTPLTEVIQMLKENYGLEVKLQGLASQTISGSFKASSVNELLEALSETLNIRIVRHTNQVLIFKEA